MSRGVYAPLYGSLAQVFQQIADDPLGQAPHDGLIEIVGGDVTGFPADLEANRVVSLGVEELVELDPTKRGNFRIGEQRRAW